MAGREAPRTRPSEVRTLWRRRGFLSLVGAVAGVTVAFRVSPWPGATIIRKLFDHGAAKTKASLQRHAATGVDQLLDQHYRADDPAALLDVYYSQGTTAGQPTIVWIHGGGWVSGDKADAAPYFTVLAAQGYTVVSLNYSYGPKRHYPTAVFQINDALSYLQDNADRLHIDVDRIVMAGDSAGSQLASQLANIITNPGYAAQMHVVPGLEPEQLRGVVLNCGVYDVTALHSAVGGLAGWGFNTTIWAYTGLKGYASEPAMAEMSTIDFTSAEFPPAFVTGGNADPLTAGQSKPFAERLDRLGVAVTTLFFPDDHEPALPHEYQFDLDTDAGNEALAQTLAFLTGCFEA